MVNITRVICETYSCSSPWTDCLFLSLSLSLKHWYVLAVYVPARGVLWRVSLESLSPSTISPSDRTIDLFVRFALLDRLNAPNILPISWLDSSSYDVTYCLPSKILVYFNNSCSHCWPITFTLATLIHCIVPCNVYTVLMQITHSLRVIHGDS